MPTPPMLCSTDINDNPSRLTVRESDQLLVKVGGCTGAERPV